MGDLLHDYPQAAPLGEVAWDEMFTATSEVRAPYDALHGVLTSLTSSDLSVKAAARDRSFRDQGITFSLSGEERPFPLDLIPRLITAEEWTVIERGVAQRVRALEAFLADAYGAAQIVADGVIPRRLVTSSAHFHRQAAGVDSGNGVRVHVAGVDLVRDIDGSFKVLEDNLRTPSGVSYVVENRKAMLRVFPELFASHRVRSVAEYPQRLLAALRASAPHNASPEPKVVLLTPGVYNSAYFEHSFLARLMGIELVEGADLVCRNNVVHMRTTDGEQRVDVVYRRIDDDYLDPLQFRPDSLVGCPGILNAARAGNVTLANAVGNGIADDKLAYTYVPDMIRYYLGEEPVLANVETYRLEDPEQREYVLSHLDAVVCKPVDASGGYGIVIGPQATDEEINTVRAAIEAAPRLWIAQRPVTLSTSPTHTPNGIRPRHLDLRPFAVNDGERVWVLPGGLTRVALREGKLVVNSSQGGGSKDTWVLADECLDAPAEAAPAVVAAPRNRIRPEAGRAGQAMQTQGSGTRKQQQRQQQQQGRPPC